MYGFKEHELFDFTTETTFVVTKKLSIIYYDTTIDAYLLQYHCLNITTNLVMFNHDILKKIIINILSA